MAIDTLINNILYYIKEVLPLLESFQIPIFSFKVLIEELDKVIIKSFLNFLLKQYFLKFRPSIKEIDKIILNDREQKIFDKKKIYIILFFHNLNVLFTNVDHYIDLYKFYIR